MQSSNDGIRNLPIDISFSRLTEFLVDRKRIPVDWRKRLATLRDQISASFSSLPNATDSYLDTLDPDGIDYIETKQIYNILLSSTSENRNIFGRPTGPAGVWKTIVNGFEKDHIFLGEAALIIAQNVNYEIPYQKNQVQKIQQQQAEMERKEVDIKRGAALAASRYTEACRELGIQGENIRIELLDTALSLQDTFKGFLEIINRDSVSRAIDYYFSIVRDAHTDEGKEPVSVLLNLKDARENPPLLNIFAASEDVLNPVTTKFDFSGGKQCAENDEGNLVATDLDISLGSSQIDGEICTHRKADEDAGGLGSFEVIDSSKLENDGVNLVVDASPSSNRQGVCVEISLIDSNDSIVPPLQNEIMIPSSPDTLSLGKKNEQRSQLLDFEYRNKILDDLHEIKAFLNQRLLELINEGSLSLQHQVQSVLPPVVNLYTSCAIEVMLSDVSLAISLLINRKICDMIMLLNSKRFLNRLIIQLEEKKKQEGRLKNNLKDLALKRRELHNSLSLSLSKQEAAVKKTRELKQICETTLSGAFEGRPLKIITPLFN